MQCTSPGLLSKVVELKATSNVSSVTISWTAPFSLDVTGVDPDIWYSVLIYNVTDENNPTAILCTDCINITETHYTFTPDYLSPCHVYNFSVIPVNGAGQGESSGDVTISMLSHLWLLSKSHFAFLFIIIVHSHFTKVDTKAVCDNVSVTFQVNVSAELVNR